MTTPIRIKRRTAPGAAGAPSSLLQAELAFNEVDRSLYYGFGVGVGGNSNSIIAIGGEGAFVTLSTDQAIGGNKTFTNAIAASLTNSLSIGAGLSQNGTSYNGGAVRTISLPYVGTPGTYGSSTAIPVITTDVYGRVSGVSTTSISTTISLTGNSGSGSVSGGGTLAIAGGTGITTSAAGSGVTVSIDGTVVTLSGTQTLTNKTINVAPATGNVFQIQGNSITSYTGSGALVVLSNTPSFSGAINLNGSVTGQTTIVASSTASGILTLPATTDTLVGKATTDTFTNKTFDTAGTGNVLKLSGNQIIGYTGSGNSVVLSNSPTLTSPTLGNATATSITGSTGNLTITAAAGNNGVYLAPTGTGTVDVGGARITSVGTPLLPTDAVNKSYADAIASSLNVHGAVQAATAAPVSYTYVGGGTSQTVTTIASNVVSFSTGHSLLINSQVRANTTGNGFISGTTYYVLTIPSLTQVTLSTSPGGNTATFTDGSGLNISTTTDQGVGAKLTGTGQTVDGYLVQQNDRVLVKDHTNSAYNGVYTVTTVGTGSNGVWTRAVDYDNLPTGEIAAGDFIFVGNGTSNGKTGFVETANGPIIVGTSAITFTQFSAAGTYIAGTGITIGSNTIAISPTYTGQSSITTVGTINSGTWNGSIIGSTYGGTGVNNGSYTITLGGNVSLASSLTTSGSFPLTLTTTASTNVTLPTTGTLATLAGNETFTNKTLSTNSVWNGNIITVPYGGSGLGTAPSNGQLLIGNGTTYTLNTLGAGTGITVANSAGSISISNIGVTALATSGNGISVNAATGSVTISTGATSANTASTIVYRDTSGNFAANTVTASSLTLSNALTVPNGGTGVGTFTSKGILYGNGTGAIQVTVAAGTGDSNTTNQILTVDGNGIPVWAAAIDGGTFAFLIGLSTLMMSIFHSGTFV